MKKNLNKIIMVMMAGLMAVSLAACGNQSKKSSDNASNKEKATKTAKKMKNKKIESKSNKTVVKIKKK